MKRELWLEYGFVHRDGFRAVCWYNEGRWQEIGYFLRELIRCWRVPGRYFLWRFGTKNHFIRYSMPVIKEAK